MVHINQIERKRQAETWEEFQCRIKWHYDINTQSAVLHYMCKLLQDLREASHKANVLWDVCYANKMEKVAFASTYAYDRKLVLMEIINQRAWVSNLKALKVWEDSTHAD